MSFRFVWGFEMVLTQLVMEELCRYSRFIPVLDKYKPISSISQQMSLDETDERSEVQRFMAHVPNIPSQADIEAALVERKKRELLQTFLGD